MMRVDVDFNERDRNGHVVARVPGAQLSRLAVGRKVYLYDPPERLWGDAVVARVNPDTGIAVFDVDWHSFVDAEVADLSDAHGHWTIGVPPTAGIGQQRDAYAASCTGKLSLRIVYTAGEGPRAIFGPTSSNAAADPDEIAAPR
jgi:hypothetical protein